MSSQNRSLNKIPGLKRQRTALLRNNSRATHRVSMPLQESLNEPSTMHLRIKETEGNSLSNRGSSTTSRHRPKGKVLEDTIMILDPIIKACRQDCRRGNNKDYNSSNNTSITVRTILSETQKRVTKIKEKQGMPARIALGQWPKMMTPL